LSGNRKAADPFGCRGLEFAGFLSQTGGLQALAPPLAALRESLDGWYADATAVCSVVIQAQPSATKPKDGMRRRAMTTGVLDIRHLLVDRRTLRLGTIAPGY
jgi:hypothetical protein